MLARMFSIQGVLLAGLLALGASPLFAQQLTSTNPSTPAKTNPSDSATLGDEWSHLKALPPHAHLHVASDHGGSTCYFISADDANLVCGHRNAGPKGQHVFPRAEVRSVKLTRRVVSTVGGLGIGLLAGGVIGSAAIRRTPGDEFNFGLAAARASCAVVGGLAGAVVGGTTDMFRGPVVYRHPPS